MAIPDPTRDPQRMRGGKCFAGEGIVLVRRGSRPRAQEARAGTHHPGAAPPTAAGAFGERIPDLHIISNVIGVGSVAIS